MTAYQIIHQYEIQISNPKSMEGEYVSANEWYETVLAEQVIANFASEQQAKDYVEKHTSWKAYDYGYANNGESNLAPTAWGEYVLLHCGKLIVRSVQVDISEVDDFDINAKYAFVIPQPVVVENFVDYFYGEFEDETEEDKAEKETATYKAALHCLNEILQVHN